MERVLVQVVRRRQLHDLAEVHDRDPVGDVPDDCEVVRDEEVREAELALQLLEQVDDLRLDRDVERRHRLVADDEVRVERERAGDADALALAARELVRVARGGVGRQADDLEQLAHLAPSSRPRPRPWTRSGSPTIRPIECRGLSEAYGSWKTICIRCAADAARASPRCVMSWPSKTDRAAGRLVQPQDRAAEGGLAAAGLADQAERLAALDRQRDAVDRLDAPTWRSRSSPLRIGKRILS